MVTSFVDADSRQEDDADRSHEDEFQRVPQQQEEHQVEPFAPPVVDESGAVDGGEEVDAAEEHGRETPFEAASGADFVEEDVRWHPPAQEHAGADAGIPQAADQHSRVSLSRTGVSRWRGWSCVGECPMLWAVCVTETRGFGSACGFSCHH